MNSLLKYLIVVVLCPVLLSACKKKAVENPQSEQKNGSFNLKFEHFAGNYRLRPDSMYTNSSNEVFKVTTFSYYVSNIALIKADGSQVPLPNTYFLVDAFNGLDPEGVSVLNIQNVPQGSYTGVSYMIGVDSTRNVSGAQSGALDPINGMFWSWNTGYIFLKLEGASSAATTTNKIFRYHIGGFRQPYASLITVQQDFQGGVININPSGTPSAHFIVNILEFFKNPNDVSIAAKSTFMEVNATTLELANNYKDMFRFYHLHN